jgi:hypothetical protein
MFAVSSRYSNDCPPPEEGKMWPAGDAYHFKAREILGKHVRVVCLTGCLLTSSFFQSVATDTLGKIPSVQAMILLGYREIGLGAMASAWFFIGHAIRAAQDIGLHRSVAKWQGEASSMFSPLEKQIRSRVWYCCVRLDKYASTYIGRPMAIHERDYDTPLPDIDEVYTCFLCLVHSILTSLAPL